MAEAIGWLFLIIGLLAMSAVVGPQSNGGNVNPPPTSSRPPAPPAPPR